MRYDLGDGNPQWRRVELHRLSVSVFLSLELRQHFAG
jgi:hypothetical protein